MKKKIFFCAFWLFVQNFLCFGQQKMVFVTGMLPGGSNTNPHLFLTGDFNGWNPADKTWEMTPDKAGKFTLFKTLPRGIYHFKVTRGNWQKVECDKKGNAVDNRVFTLVNDTTITLNIAAWQDSFPAKTKEHTASAQVHIINERFNMPQLGRQSRIWIYLPKDYQSSKRSYPVIYMHDGQNLFDNYTSGYGEWGIDEILDKMTGNKECIVVGIDHGGEYRITEYDPYDSKYGKGKGDDYVNFLIKTLKPYIDGYYRTKSGSKNTTIAGSSMGGLISMYAALKYPGVFGSAGIFSPAFWIAPEIYRFAEQQKLSSKSRFYFVCGDAESDTMVADMQKMVNIIRQKLPDTNKSPEIIVKGASHNEKQWNNDFPGFYEWLFGSRKSQ